MAVKPVLTKGTEYAHCTTTLATPTKGQIILKGLLVSSDSPKKRMNKLLHRRFLGEFEDTKKSFQNYLTFGINVKNCMPEDS